MSAFAGISLAVVSSIIAVGLVQVVKQFLPEDASSKLKAGIALGIEVVIGLVAAIAQAYFMGFNFFTFAMVLLATAALSQLFYDVIVALIAKLTSLIKSKTDKKEE